MNKEQKIGYIRKTSHQYFGKDKAIEIAGYDFIKE